GVWTVSPAMRLIVPKATTSYVAEHLGIHPALPIGIADDETVTFADINITGLSLNAAQDEQDLGQDVAYVYQFGEQFTCLHASRIPADSTFIERVRAHKIDVALLPISHEQSENTRIIEFAREIGAEAVIPHTVDPVEHETDLLDTFVEQATEVNLAVRPLKPGERWSNAR
ncbi:MAG: hypothetical protein KDD84_18615, partial [Caldilineaceae bacterium]|nr:hypothetical protein [Caldilineaceae bacterium]